jgi:hypothetical protein
MTTGGWLLMATLWAVLLGAAIVAVCRLFPTHRDSGTRTLDAPLAAPEPDLAHPPEPGPFGTVTPRPTMRG